MGQSTSKATSFTTNGTLVWTDDASVFDTFMAVTPTHFVAATLIGKDLDAARAAAQADGDAVAAVGKKGTVIPIAQIAKITANLKGDDLVVRFNAGTKQESKTYSSLALPMRDGILAALESGLGSDVQRSEVQFGAGRAIVKPGIAIIVTAAFGWICFVAAQGMADGEDAEISGRRGLLKRVFAWCLELLGPIGVAIVFGLILLLMVVWLVKRVGTPPVMLTLTRG